MRRDVQLIHLGLAYYGKTQKCAADEKLIGKGVDNAAEFAGYVEGSGEFAVYNVGNACYDKQDKSDKKEI